MSDMRAVMCFIFGLLAGVGVFAAAIAAQQWAWGFASAFLGFSLFCALCVWALSWDQIEAAIKSR